MQKNYKDNYEEKALFRYCKFNKEFLSYSNESLCSIKPPKDAIYLRRWNTSATMTTDDLHHDCRIIIDEIPESYDYCSVNCPYAVVYANAHEFEKAVEEEFIRKAFCGENE